MLNRKTSDCPVRSKFSLTLMLVMFIGQIFATCVSASIQLPNEQHPYGTQIAHHHSDHHNEQTHNNIAADNTVTDNTATDNKAADGEENSEHEHESHSHLSCYPPVDHRVISALASVDVIENAPMSYPNYNYAPPIPPPSV